MPVETLLLEVVAGNASGSQIEVEHGFLIGRGAPGAGALADDHEISRQHARISRAPEGDFVIEDLGSTNGTFVNGVRIDGPQPLADGDRVDVGTTRLVVHVPMAPDSAREETAARAVSAETTAQPRAAGIPALSLRIDIDLAARAATLALDDTSDEVRLEYVDGGWRIAG